MAGKIPAALQVAMIEDPTNSAFLPSLRFFELTDVNIWTSFPTPEQRLDFIDELKDKTTMKACGDIINHVFPDFSTDGPEFNTGNNARDREAINNASDNYIRACLNDFVSIVNGQVAETLHIFVAYDIATHPEEESAGIVGFIACTLPNIQDNIFRYIAPVRGLELLAAVGYINWTCSLTDLPEISYILSNKLHNNPGRKLSIGAFLLYNLTRTFVNYIVNRVPLQIDLFIFFSEALPTARSAHRRVGKRSACTFLSQWESISKPGNGIYNIFDEGPNNNHMIYTYRPLSGIYQIFPADQEPRPDLDIFNFFAGSALLNRSYRCPSGVPVSNQVGGRRRKTRRRRR